MMTGKNQNVGIETPTTTLAWPEIEGISSGAVRERLDDDLELFLSLIERFLTEFADIRAWLSASGDTGAVPLSRRMHKLAGSAGMLGAQAINTLAVEAEAMCSEADVKGAARLLAELAMQLDRLRRAATPALEAARQRAEAAAASGDGSSRRRSAIDLVALLDTNNMSAVGRFSHLAPQLRRLLSDDAFELIRDHIEKLRFREAADALRHALAA